MNVVVDTNVAVAANGRDTHASLACQYSCAVFLAELVSPGKRTHIVLDKSGLIFSEYSDYLHYKGQPGVGDAFFKYLHDHMHLDKKIKLVPITPIADESRGFEELPQNLMDRNDRKFLAVAITADAKIVNALDTDWHERAKFVTHLGVNMQQLCPEHGCI